MPWCPHPTFSALSHICNHWCILMRNATSWFAREMVSTSHPPMMLSCVKRNILPLLLRFQTQKETRISYPSNNSRHLPYSIPDAIGIKHKTNSSHPSVARFSLLQNCNHYKKSSQPATVIEHSLSSRNTWERFPSHNETKACSDPKSLSVLFTSTFWWLFDDMVRWFFVTFAQFWRRGNVATDGCWSDCASLTCCSLYLVKVCGFCQENGKAGV